MTVTGWCGRVSTGEHPAQAHEVSADDRTLSILAPTRLIAARGDVLDRPTATVSLSSPLSGVIRVRIEHHAGIRDRGPRFALRRGLSRRDHRHR